MGLSRMINSTATEVIKWNTFGQNIKKLKIHVLSFYVAMQ